MIARIDIRGRQTDGNPGLDYRHLVPRADFDVAAAAVQVAPLCEDVRLRGSAAVRDIALRFDGVELDDIRVDPAQLAAAADALEPGSSVPRFSSPSGVSARCARANSTTSRSPRWPRARP